MRCKVCDYTSYSFVNKLYRIIYNLLKLLKRKLFVNKRTFLAENRHKKIGCYLEVSLPELRWESCRLLGLHHLVGCRM